MEKNMKITICDILFIILELPFWLMLLLYFFRYDYYFSGYNYYFLTNILGLIFMPIYLYFMMGIFYLLNIPIILTVSIFNIFILFISIKKIIFYIKYIKNNLPIIKNVKALCLMIFLYIPIFIKSIIFLLFNILLFIEYL